MESFDLTIDENIYEINKKLLNELLISTTIEKLDEKLIVKYFDVWFENKYNIINEKKIYEKNLSFYIQMEFCDKTLREIIEEIIHDPNLCTNQTLTQIGYYIASELFIELLECVQYLHKFKIIHRDLKPENFLITNGMNGRFVKIADFGEIAFHKFDAQTHTEGKGTVRYVAPEVSNSRKYDTKADIFSLGVIFQQLFSIDPNRY
jgi:serine/threonine protein kinase